MFQKIFSAATMSGTNTIRSTPIRNDGVLGLSFQGVWTGTPTGNATSWVIKISNNYNPASETIPGDPTTGGDWTNVGATISSGANPAGAAGSCTFDILTYARWVMFEYVNASGAGTLNAWVSGPPSAGKS